MYKTALSRHPLFPDEVRRLDIPGYIADPVSPVPHLQGWRSHGASSLDLIFQPSSSVLFFLYSHNYLFSSSFFFFRTFVLRRALRFCKGLPDTWKRLFNMNRCSKQTTGEQHKHRKAHPGIYSLSSSSTRCNIYIFNTFWKNSLPFISPVNVFEATLIFIIQHPIPRNSKHLPCEGQLPIVSF